VDDRKFEQLDYTFSDEILLGIISKDITFGTEFAMGDIL
jgi:hypothetical protein